MSEAMLIDGKALADRMNRETAAAVARLGHENGVQPGLAVVLVGKDPASQVYVRNKRRATVAAGMRSFEHKLPASAGAAAVLALVAKLNADPAVDGILVQLPLPAGLEAAPVLDAIDPDKDVDGLHVVNAGRLALGVDGMVPCTPQGCMHLIDTVGRPLEGLRALVLGRSNLVGKPVAQLLLQRHCTVTMAHSRTRHLPEECRRADILIAAVGRPEMVRGSWIKPGAIVIDVGINRVERQGKPILVGDVLFAEARTVAGHLTPVPGGAGPMTIACLLSNTLKAACRRRGIKLPSVG
ncbi:MAG: bifunctional methylenetetrahydrofolate dehydrogenase/methenyltetrahydrofolate cyclohydrolase FolD [Proteobacteria bacterium]|nr:bifunctional methylenetetrahydrofolate dehydrogenase/methenyltetrahydrofolate cyclohydrolase FolD [Pseudomonadota bacterium]MBI3499560.1 bifunctional methylenetetrahydrofolate dehydrogenase/methenyltetrahydrofolate cyclohydrolase FolD [Pseudomonadota bacterium]